MNGWILLPLALTANATSADQLRLSDVPKIAPRLAEIVQSAAASSPIVVLELGGGVPLPLSAMARSVETHHPKLAAAEERRLQAEGEAMSARGGFDPVLKVSGDLWPEGFYSFNRLEAKLEQATPLWGAALFGSYRVGTGDLPVYQEQDRTLVDGEIKAGLTVPVFRDGPIDENRAGIRQTAQAARAARFDRDTTRLVLLLDGASAYWKWVAAGQAYQIILDLLRLAEARDQQLAQKVRRGAVAEIDRAENLRAVLDRRLDLVAAQRTLEQAAIKLSLFLRTNEGTPRVPDPSELPNLPEPIPPRPEELPAGQANAIANRPELDFFEAEINKAKVGLRLAENQLAPEFDLSLSVARDLGAANGQEKFEELHPLELKLALDFKLPVLLRKARGKRAKAAGKLSEVQQKARFQRDKIETEVLNLWSALVARAEQSRLADETFLIAAAVAAAERRRFDLGATNLFIVNLREQKAAEAATKRIKAQAEFAITRSAWALATETELILPND